MDKEMRIAKESKADRKKKLLELIKNGDVKIVKNGK